MSKKRGFTLVELLVVIAIIALLMSILMPALSRAKKQARDAVCKANLKQWGSVFSMYANAHNNRFFAGWMGSAVTRHTDQWPSALRPYYGDDGDFRLCPSVQTPATERSDRTFPGSVTEAWGIFESGDATWGVKPGDYGSYGVNAWVGNPLPTSELYVQSWTAMAQAHWRGDNVNGAATVPLFIDCLWMETWPCHWESPPSYPWEPYIYWDNSMWRLMSLRHQNHLNCLFLDYSVDRVGLTELWTLKWNRKFDTCNRWTECGGVKLSDWPQWMRGL